VTEFKESLEAKEKLQKNNNRKIGLDEQRAAWHRFFINQLQHNVQFSMV